MTLIKKIIYPLAIAITVCLDAFLIGKVHQLKRNLSNCQIVNQKSNDHTDLATRLKESTLASFEQEGKLFPKHIYVINNEGKRVQLNDITKGKKCVFFRITTFSCDVCVENQLNILMRNFNNPKSELFILATMDFKLFKLKYGNDFSNVKTYFLPVEFEEQFDRNNYHYPYYFFVDLGIIQNIFYPLREFPEITDSYLKMVIKKLE